MLSRPDAQMPRSLKPRARVSVTEYNLHCKYDTSFDIFWLICRELYRLNDEIAFRRYFAIDGRITIANTTHLVI